MAIATTSRNGRKRSRLLERFQSRIRLNRRLDRSLVSFQANRKAAFVSWFKYKEGFSAELVRYVINEFGQAPGTLLDPFAGIGTALFVARSLGWDAIGIELLPVGFFSADARLAAEAVDPAAFKRKIDAVADIDWRRHFDPDHALPHIPITRGAFPIETEEAIAGYRAYCNRRIRNRHVRKLFDLAGLAVLESVSYTRKDGQYLRWDYRAKKARVKSRFDKGAIPDFNSAIGKKLRQISNDLARGTGEHDNLFELCSNRSARVGAADLRQGSCLDILPRFADESIDFVLTSPPYCNRYDYTRTYALELIYLGLDEAQVKDLRQAMLSCTVENRTKIEQMETAYDRLGRGSTFSQVRRTFEKQSALHEVFAILDEEAQENRLNNSNIPRMVWNYFLEMCFVVYELARILRPGGRIVMVNDNVRYAGEEVPVDLILSDFARTFGLRVEHIWTLPRGKGNSSQQMGVHGRTELRKCVYVWHKP